MIVPPLLAVANLSYGWRGRYLFRKLSFEISSGEVLVVMGPNGSGKTTLLRCVAGIPDAFSTVTKTKPQAYVGHLNALKAQATVRQNLLYQTGATPEELTNTLVDLKLSSLLDREIRTLSAGQRRQVALARLPLSKASLWLVDEPTAHLDEAATARFWKLLQLHLKGGGAAVLTAHTPVPLPQAKVMVLHG